MAQYAVTLVLADSASLKEATLAILRGIGESLGLQLSMFWRVDEQAGVLRFVDLWHSPKIDASEFIEGSRDRNIHQGTELIERVWKTGKPFWAWDIGAATGFHRAPMAARVGLDGWFALPVRKGERIYGVIECYGPEICEPDHQVLHMVADIGIKVGQFVDRKETEALVSLIEDLAGVKLERRYELDAPRGVAGRNSDNTFIQQVLGWEPSTPLHNGLEKTYAWIEEQYTDRKAGKRTVREAFVPVD